MEPSVASSIADLTLVLEESPKEIIEASELLRSDAVLLDKNLNITYRTSYL